MNSSFTPSENRFSRNLEELSLHHRWTPAAAQSWGPSPRPALCHRVPVFILHYDSENSDTPACFLSSPATPPPPERSLRVCEVVTLCDNVARGYCFNTWRRKERLGQNTLLGFFFFYRTCLSKRMFPEDSTLKRTGFAVGFYEKMWVTVNQLRYSSTQEIKTDFKSKIIQQPQKRERTQTCCIFTEYICSSECCFQATFV